MDLLLLPRIGSGKLIIVGKKKLLLPTGETVVVDDVRADADHPDFGPFAAEFNKHGRSQGQSSSYRFGVHRLGLVHVHDVDPRTIEKLLAWHGDKAKHVGRALKPKHADRLHRALNEKADGWNELVEAWEALDRHAAHVRKQKKGPTKRQREEHIGLLRACHLHSHRVMRHHLGAAGEWIAAYRAIAEKLEREEDGAIYAMAVLTSGDATNSGSNDIDGLPIIAQWAGGASDHFYAKYGAGVFNVESGYYKDNGGGEAVDATQGDLADGMVTARGISGVGAFGAVRRLSSHDDFYVTYDEEPLRQYVKTGGTLTQLGSDGTNTGYGFFAHRDVGTSHWSYNVGSVDIGPNTDTAHATGKAGIGGLGFSWGDRFKNEDEGDPTPQYSWPTPITIQTTVPSGPHAATKVSGNDADHFEEADTDDPPLAAAGGAIDPDTGDVNYTAPNGAEAGSPYVFHFIPSNTPDGAGDPFAQSVTVELGPPAFTLNAALPFIDAVRGHELRIPIANTGGTVDTWDFDAGAAPPAGVSIENVAGQYYFVVAPTTDYGRTAAIILTANNATGIAQYEFALLVQVLLPAQRITVIPYDVVPDLDGNPDVGVKAWHWTGPVASVEVVVDGAGAPIPLVRRLSARTMIELEWCLDLSTLGLADGPHTFEFTTTAQDGETVSETITLNTNFDGTLDRPLAIVAVDGDDDTAEIDGGAEAHPFATVDAARAAIFADRGDCRNARILFKANPKVLDGNGDVVSGGWPQPHGGGKETTGLCHYLAHPSTTPDQAPICYVGTEAHAAGAWRPKWHLPFYRVNCQGITAGDGDRQFSFGPGYEFEGKGRTVNDSTLPPQDANHPQGVFGVGRPLPLGADWKTDAGHLCVVKKSFAGPSFWRLLVNCRVEEIAQQVMDVGGGGLWDNIYARKNDYRGIVPAPHNDMLRGNPRNAEPDGTGDFATIIGRIVTDEVSIFGLMRDGGLPRTKRLTGFHVLGPVLHDPDLEIAPATSWRLEVSAMGCSMRGLTAPYGGVLLDKNPDDTGPQISFFTLRNSIVSGLTIDFGYVQVVGLDVAHNHFVGGAPYGTDHTEGGDPAAPGGLFVDSEANDWRPAKAGVLVSRVPSDENPNLLDAAGLPYRALGAVGAYEQAPSAVSGAPEHPRSEIHAALHSPLHGAEASPIL